MKFLHSAVKKGIDTKNWFVGASLTVKISLITILVLVVGFGIYLLTQNKSTTPQFQTGQVERGSVISTVSESGNVSSDSQTNITSPTDGVIQEMYAKNGDQVAAGQNLFKVKSTATEQEKAAEYASYASAQSSEKTAEQSKLVADADMWSKQQAVLNAQNDVDYKNGHSENPSTNATYTDLEKQNIESALIQAKKSFTASETKFKEADIAVNAAKAQLTSAWLSYQATQDSVVKSPIAGTVANLSAKVGSNVTAGSNNSSGSSSSSSSSTSTATTVLVLGDFSALNIKAAASEVDISKIKAGQKATITLDAFTDKTFAGTVESVDTIGTSSSGVVTYNVYIGFISPPSDIQPGMTATAIIQLEKHDDVLMVPNSAVQKLNGSSYVRIIKNGQITQVPVETGLVSDTNTEIISGLTEGQTIVTSITTTGTGSSTSTTSPFSGTRGFGGGGGRGGVAPVLIQR